MKLRDQDYSAEERERIISHVCEQLAEKRSISRILREDKLSHQLCSQPTWTRWMHVYPDELKGRVERAREQAAEAYVDEIVEIADGRDDAPSIDPQIRKLRVYAREKAAAMIAPRRYGQKVDITSGGEKLPAPAPMVAVQDNRIQTLIHIAAQRKAMGPVDAEALNRLLED